MKANRLKFYVAGFALMFILGIAMTPMVANAQDGDKEKTEAATDNSSSFNDSVQFDDMEPIFYEAKEEVEEVATEDSSSSMMLYVGIAIALIIILIVLKKVGKKKA